MAQSSFDLEHGLSQPADHANLQIPHNILQVIGLIEAPALGPLGPPGPQDPHNQVNPVVDDVEGLDQALINFQRIEHESYGRFIRPEPAYGRDELDPQDYWDQDSENESMDSNSEAATDLVICDSSLEKIITLPGGDQIRIADGVSVNLKAAANGSAILEDDQEFIC